MSFRKPGYTPLDSPLIASFARIYHCNSTALLTAYLESSRHDQS